MRPLHDKTAAHIGRLSHDLDHRARHFDFKRDDLPLGPVVKQAVGNVLRLQFIYSNGV